MNVQSSPISFHVGYCRSYFKMEGVEVPLFFFQKWRVSENWVGRKITSSQASGFSESSGATSYTGIGNFHCKRLHFTLPIHSDSGKSDHLE